MNTKTVITGFLAIAALLAVAGTSQAAVQAAFGVNLYPGTMNSVNVRNLQSFLTSTGFYSGAVTGNYLTATQAAVKNYQKANGISATGTFGPLTRAMANAARGSTVASTEGSLSLVSPVTGSVEVGAEQSVKWTSKGTVPAKVSINLIKKVADNPARYELVRTIAQTTSNDGTATWVPATTDAGNSLSLEVGCGPSANACHAGESASASLAVVNSGRYANTASAFQAIEASKNK